MSKLLIEAIEKMVEDFASLDLSAPSEIRVSQRVIDRFVYETASIMSLTEDSNSRIGEIYYRGIRLYVD